MGPLDFAIHLLSFVAPALVVAVLMALLGRLVLPRPAPAAKWWVPVALNFLAGVLVLTGGLLFYGRDGKMATYAALVVVVATSQWLSARAWRS